MMCSRTLGFARARRRQVRRSPATGIAIALTSWLTSTWAFSWLEARGARVNEPPHRGGISVILLGLLMAIPNFVAAHPGWGLVVDSHGSVYFTDLERVWKIDTEGRDSVFVDNVHTHELYLDETGMLYGEHEWFDPNSERFHTRYWIATPAGHVSAVSEDEAARFFDRWDSAGNHYTFTNDQERAVVLKTPPQGPTHRIAGGPFGYADGPGPTARFRLFGASVVGPDGRFYVTNGGLLRSVDTDGTTMTLAGPEQGFPHSVQGDGRPRYSALLGLAVAADGTVFFADIDQRKVFRINPDGALAIVLEPDAFWTPVGVALAGGDVYFLEVRRDFASPTNRIGASGPRVRKLSPDGSVTVVGVAGK